MTGRVVFSPFPFLFPLFFFSLAGRPAVHDPRRVPGVGGDYRIWRVLMRPIVALNSLGPFLWVLCRNLPLSPPPPLPPQLVVPCVHMVLKIFICHARDYANDLLAGSATRCCSIAPTLTGTNLFRWMVVGGPISKM